MRSRLNGAEIAMAIDVTLYQPGDEDIVLKLAKWFNEIHNAETPSPSSATASELLDESLRRKLHTLFYLPVKTLFADMIFGASTDSVSVNAQHKIESQRRFLRIQKRLPITDILAYGLPNLYLCGLSQNLT